MKIAICDDDVLALRITSQIIEDYIVKNKPKLISFIKYNSPGDLIKAINQGETYDVFLLDILMPEYNGIELAKIIQTKKNVSRIIFLTVTPEFAVKSYEVFAFYYLMKPINTKQLYSLLDDIYSKISSESNNSLVITSFGNIINLNVKSIQYVEVMQHKIHVHMNDHNVYSTYGSLKDILSKLEEFNGFTQCHKSYIVNLDYVAMLYEHNFKMKNNILIPISRKYYNFTKQVFIRYISTHA